jgi:hypothetical protein
MANTIYTNQSPYANVSLSMNSSAVSYPLQSASLGNLTVSVGGTGGSGVSYGTTWTTHGSTSLKPNTIHVQGDAVFEGNITWQDRDMREWFASVESRLAILQPNTKLEAEYEELVQLRQQYVELERKLLERQQVFDILKKS